MVLNSKEMFWVFRRLSAEEQRAVKASKAMANTRNFGGKTSLTMAMKVWVDERDLSMNIMINKDVANEIGHEWCINCSFRHVR